MESYSDFALVYDLFMEEVPYERWGELLTEKFTQYSIPKGLVLDLCCGTGTMTEYLAELGYDMIGLDSSPMMLDEAVKKRDVSGRDILYLCQDMREFELYGTVGAIVSLCDSINYITDYEDLVQVFRLANNYLDPGGVFIFDVNTHRKYSRIGESTIAENRPEASFIWENYYDAEAGINEYELTLFIREAGGLYRRSEEVHTQKVWGDEDIKGAAGEAGLLFLESFDADSGKEAGDESERVFYILREWGK